MQNTSVNPNMKFAPPERLVIDPPRRMYRYSLYDELKLGDDKYKEIKSAIARPTKTTKQINRERNISNILKLAVLLGAGFLGWKNRAWVVEQFKKIPYLNGKK